MLKIFGVLIIFVSRVWSETRHSYSLPRHKADAVQFLVFILVS